MAEAGRMTVDVPVELRGATDAPWESPTEEYWQALLADVDERAHAGTLD